MSELNPAAEVTGATTGGRPDNEIVKYHLVSTSHAPPPPVQIHFNEGTIYATPNGGAIRARRDTPVSWECDRPFTIRFAQLGGQAKPLKPLDGELKSGRFVAELDLPDLGEGAQQPYYEYTITVDDLQLDPIVIVDK